MTFNGEIYNFAELRRELEGHGHRFRGYSDTEVTLAAFEKFGIEPALRRFVGVFALAVWDRRDRVLHLMRDRLGKKPLYIALVGGALLFASELKATREFPGFQARVDAAALAMVLRRGWVPDRHCIWEDVFKLPPGAMLSIWADDLRTGGIDRLRTRIRNWWSLAEVAEKGQRNPPKLRPADLEREHWARDLLDASRIRREGFLDPDKVDNCWQEHLSGQVDRARELWSTLMVQAWLEAMRRSPSILPVSPISEPAMSAALAMTRGRKGHHAIQQRVGSFN